MMRPLFAAIALLAACGGSQINVAPEVQPSMYRIANQLVSLDKAFGLEEPARQAAAKAALDEIGEVARELATTELRKSHELLRDEIDGFVADINRARAEASATPPNYYWAGKIHAACVRCHDPEGGVWNK